MATKKKKAVAKKKTKKNAVPDLVVKSKVKELISGAGCFSSADVFDSLNGLVAWYVEQATKRATENKRKTVRGHDFIIM